MMRMEEEGGFRELFDFVGESNQSVAQYNTRPRRLSFYTHHFSAKHQTRLCSMNAGNFFPNGERASLPLIHPI